MQIYVCVKHVPDTAATINVVGDTGYNDTACKFIINPYDEYAVEEAVQRVEKAGSGEVVVVTVGPEAAVSTMRAAMAMGAHRGILVTIDSQFLDSQTTARALAAAIDTRGVGRAAHHVVAHAGEVLHAAPADHHDRVFLQVVADTGDVGRHLDPVGQPDPGHLAQGRVRLLRRGGVDASTDAAALWTALQGGYVALFDLALPRLTNQLVDRCHSVRTPK